MYRCIEHALYRAFNVAELLYQKNNLARLYRAPDWEQIVPDYAGGTMTPIERIHEDSKVYKVLRSFLPKEDFSVLRICYSCGCDIEEWRRDLSIINHEIKNCIGNVKFNPVIYEYTCIKHLTGRKLKPLYIDNSSVRRNSRRLQKILSDIRCRAEKNANSTLCIYGYID